MGPITLFDKSFLQSLSIDESVWFDHFFSPVICPLFYVETLADLGKSVKYGRSPEQEVGIIADKFPEMHGSPTAEHVSVCTAELFGQRVPMKGQILIPEGRHVRAGSQTGIIVDESPESKAFSRWQKREFNSIERDQAQVWRQMITNLDLNEMGARFRRLGIDGKSCKTLQQAKELAEQIVSSEDRPLDRMHLALLFLDIDPSYYQEILTRWSAYNYPPLRIYAPYVAYVFTIEIFFQISLAANLISSVRPSNRIDIGYLFYLPFSMAFVSSDKLHKKCAPLFLRKNQRFFWGPELKECLRELNEYYSQLPEDERDKGVMSFASSPPIKGDYIIAQIWDSFFPSWRDPKGLGQTDKKHNHDELLAHIKKIQEAPTIPVEEVDFDNSDANIMSIERRVKRRKGSWFQVPKDLKHDK